MNRTHKEGDLLVVDFNQAINLTYHHVGMYDNAGNIVSFHPGCSPTALNQLDPTTMVILNDIADGKAYGVPAENAVVVYECSIGRSGHRVCRLVRPEDGAYVRFVPTLPAAKLSEYYSL